MKWHIFPEPQKWASFVLRNSERSKVPQLFLNESRHIMLHKMEITLLVIYRFQNKVQWLETGQSSTIFVDCEWRLKEHDAKRPKETAYLVLGWGDGLITLTACAYRLTTIWIHSSYLLSSLNFDLTSQRRI